MKAEWMALKDRNLYVGSIGRDWTTGKGVSSPNLQLFFIYLF